MFKAKLLTALVLSLAFLFPTPEVSATTISQQDQLMCKLIKNLVTSGAFTIANGSQTGTTRLAIREASLLADTKSALLKAGFAEAKDGFMYSPDGMTDVLLLSIFCPPDTPIGKSAPNSPAVIILISGIAVISLLILTLLGRIRRTALQS